MQTVAVYRNKAGLLGDLLPTNRLAKALTVPAASNDFTLWDAKPQPKWIDALPLGNCPTRQRGLWRAAKTEAFNKELLQFNEDHPMSGQPSDGNNRDAKNHLVAYTRRQYFGNKQRTIISRSTSAEDAGPVCRILFNHSANLQAGSHSLWPIQNFRPSSSIRYPLRHFLNAVERVPSKREALVSLPIRVLVLGASRGAHTDRGNPHPDSRLQTTVKALTRKTVSCSTEKPLPTSGCVPFRHSENRLSPHSDEIGAGMYFAPCRGFSLEGGKLPPSANQPASP